MKNEIDTDIVDELIDKFYNELDKRICKNCKHLKVFTGGCAEDKAHYCDKCDGFIYCIDKMSCIDFKQKEEK